MSSARRRVIKRGGTSVGTADRLETSLGVVEASARQRPVVVVTSALAGVTNALVAALAGAAAWPLPPSSTPSASGTSHCCAR